MMSLVEFFSQPLWHRLGLTLIHFLWQGLAVAVIVYAAVRVLRLKRGNPRYAAYLLAFGGMAVSPLLTFMILGVPTQPAPAPAGSIAPGLLPEIESSGSVPRSLSPEPAPPRRENALPVGPTHPIPLRQRFDSALQASLPWALLGWMGGVLVLSVRLLLGFLGVRRWRRHVEPLAGDLETRIVRLSERLGLPGFARVFTSRHACEVVALGYLRPMVLLPTAFASQMPPEMLEAVIAHELAHIRRCDLWVNLAQRVVETVLFYHPAVWWLSSRLRGERELCCDELAVKATGERLTYASALENAGRVRLAALRQPALAVGLGQGKKSTLSRVRHVLGLPPTPPDSRFWLAGVIAVVLLAVLAVPTISALTARAEAQQTTTQSADKPAADSEKPEQPRFAARTFNSSLALYVYVQETVQGNSRRLGQTPSAAPLEIPACYLWYVIPTGPVKDWATLARQVTRSEIPGLMLYRATDSDLHQFQSLAGLEYLGLANSQITDGGLEQLKDLTSLRWLNLLGANITDAGLKYLQGLANLQVLNLERTVITDAGLENLRGLTQLQGLYLGYNARITDAGLAHLKKLVELRSLSLERARITDAGLAHLQSLTKLQVLVLGYNGRITDAGLVHLQRLTELQSLDVKSTGVTDAGLEHLQGLTKLRWDSPRHENPPFQAYPAPSGGRRGCRAGPNAARPRRRCQREGQAWLDTSA